MALFLFCIVTEGTKV